MGTDLIYDLKRKMLAKYPRFGGEIAAANIEYRDDLKYHTASTDGKNIYVDPNFFASISEDERLFTIAHEIMHIKFRHISRMKDKSGKMRDLKLWNTATDAIINANLQRDGFTIKDGFVNMPEALKYSAEEFYQILLQRKEKEEQENGEDKNSNQDSNADQKQTDDNEQGDDHSIWKEAFEQQNSQKQKDGNEQGQRQEYEEEQNDFDERGEFKKNRKEKIAKFKAMREEAEREGPTSGKIKFENIGESREQIDWKVLIRREIEKDETVWSQRRSVAENNYAYRLEDNDMEDEAETEIMIDVSGSVNLDLIKAFLRQIKPLLSQSKLRVGCFNEKFWDFLDIKSLKDIDNFSIPSEARGSSAWTEDWDLAVRSFSKRREVNKIVFTDGYPCPGVMPKEDLKKENVIWLVYGNKNFNPCCGKVININEKQLEKLHQVDTRECTEDFSR